MGVKYKLTSNQETYNYGKWNRSGQSLVLDLDMSIVQELITINNVSKFLPPILGDIKVEEIEYVSYTKSNSKNHNYNEYSAHLKIQGWKEYEEILFRDEAFAAKLDKLLE